MTDERSVEDLLSFIDGDADKEADGKAKSKSKKKKAKKKVKEDHGAADEQGIVLEKGDSGVMEGALNHRMMRAQVRVVPFEI